MSLEVSEQKATFRIESHVDISRIGPFRSVISEPRCSSPLDYLHASCLGPAQPPPPLPLPVNLRLSDCPSLFPQHRRKRAAGAPPSRQWFKLLSVEGVSRHGMCGQALCPARFPPGLEVRTRVLVPAQPPVSCKDEPLPVSRSVRGKFIKTPLALASALAFKGI